MKLVVQRIALGLARSGFGARVVSSIVRVLPRLAPGVICVESSLVIMRHPVPVQAGHLLAVSRQGVLDALAATSKSDLFWQQLDSWLIGNGRGLGIHGAVTNLGDRQDVRLLHVHLLEQVPAWMPLQPSAKDRTLWGTWMRLKLALPESIRSASLGFCLDEDCNWYGSANLDL